MSIRIKNKNGIERLLPLIVLALILNLFLGARESVAQDPSPQYRVLLVGDSWTAYMWRNGTLRTLFSQFGHADKLEKGDRTALAGATAAIWATQPFLDLITDELNANPTIDCVHISLGGNDFLAGAAAGGWHMGLTQSQQDALFNTIVANINAVVQHCLSIRPNVSVVICGYDYLNLVESVLRDPAGACALLWSNLGTPLPRQANDALAALEGQKRDLALASGGRVTYVHNLGAMQFGFGYPSLGFPPFLVSFPGGAPDYTPFPGGNPDFPSPPEAMADIGRGRRDCIHLSPQGYLGIGLNCVAQFYLPKFEASE